MRTLIGFCLFVSLFPLFPEPAFGTEAADAGPKLRIFFLPTYPVRLDWSTPATALQTTIDGIFHNRTAPIGHVNIQVDCGPGDEQVYGAVGAGPGPIGRLLLMDQVGYSLLERGWVGKLEARDHILKTFGARGHDANQLAVVTFLISPAACKRLQIYADRFATEVQPMYYGFAPRPRHREGSGCSAFGASFAEVAGVLTPELTAAWTLERLVPLSLMAGHGNDRVPVSTILHSPAGQRWAQSGEGHMDLTFYDPDRMYDWVVKLSRDPAALAALGGQRDTALPFGIDGVPAIRLDRRATPVPTEPIFNGAPDLAPDGPISVIRRDVPARGDGSFALKP